MPLQVTHDDRRRETIIAVTGVFDREAAAKLRGVLRASPAPEPGRVVLDFSKAREVTDTALAALLDAAPASVKLRLRGTTQRQDRLLKLLSASDERRAQR